MKCIRCQLEHDGRYGSGKYCSKKCRYLFDEARNKKISLAHTGRVRGPMTEEQKKKISLSKKGIKRAPFSEEHKQNMSKSMTGIKRPYICGKNNPNYNGRYSNDPEIREMFLKKVKERGQCWGEEQKYKHSQTMKGNSNWMRGKHHSDETKEKIRKTILLKFESGERIQSKIMVSKYEMEIGKILTDMGYSIKMGVRLCNNLYDIFIPEKNLIIEFNGDYWHMNPSKYLAEDYNKSCNMTAKEIWDKDKLKMENAINHGYKVCYIWENEYNAQANKVDFIENMIKNI